MDHVRVELTTHERGNGGRHRREIRQQQLHDVEGNNSNHSFGLNRMSTQSEAPQHHHFYFYARGYKYNMTTLPGGHVRLRFDISVHLLLNCLIPFF